MGITSSNSYLRFLKPKYSGSLLLLVLFASRNCLSLLALIFCGHFQPTLDMPSFSLQGWKGTIKNLGFFCLLCTFHSLHFYDLCLVANNLHYLPHVPIGWDKIPVLVSERYSRLPCALMFFPMLWFTLLDSFCYLHGGFTLPFKLTRLFTKLKTMFSNAFSKASSTFLLSFEARFASSLCSFSRNTVQFSRCFDCEWGRFGHCYEAMFWSSVSVCPNYLHRGIAAADRPAQVVVGVCE